MRGEERLGAAGDAERALQLGPRRDDGPSRGDRQRQRPGRVAARASHRERRPDDRVLAAAVDRPVVGEEGVGDLAEPPPGVLVVDRDRLVGAVAARHHERHADVVAEQVVERGVGEHQPEPRRPARRPTARRERPPAARRARSGASTPRSSASSSAVSSASVVRARRHHGERLLLAQLPRAQAGDGLLVGRVAGEVVAAEALHREDPPLAAGGRRPPRAAASAAGRSRGRRSARRGSGGRRDPRTRGGRRRRAGSRPSSCAAGRTERRSRS